MSYRKSLSILGFTTLSLCIGGADAHISGSYPGKDIQTGREMRCEAEPTDPRIAPGEILFPEVTFNETTSAYELKGQTVCAEFDLLGNKVSDDFVVNVVQQTLQNGLTATKQDNGGGDFLWTFKFTVVNGGPAEVLLYHYVPKDPVTGLFTPFNNKSPACIIPGSSGPPFAYFDPCFAQVGTPPNAMANDFPSGRDVDGDNIADLGKGEVFIYRVIQTASGGQKPVVLHDGSCHSGTFNGLVGVNEKCQFSLTGKPKDAQPTRGKSSGEPHLNVGIDIQPDSTDNFLDRSVDNTATMPVRVFGSADVDVSKLQNVLLEGVVPTSSSIAGVNLDLIFNIQALITASTALQDANPGDKVFLSLTANLVDNGNATEVGGSDFVEIIQPVRVDYRPGCGDNLSLNNPSGKDPVGVLGGPVGNYDNVDVAQINTSTVVFAVKNQEGNTANVPLTFNSNDDVSGNNCAGTAGDDGTPDGFFTDAQFTVDVFTLFTNSKDLQDAPNGQVVELPLTGQLLNGARMEGTATVHVQKSP